MSMQGSVGTARREREREGEGDGMIPTNPLIDRVDCSLAGQQPLTSQDLAALAALSTMASTLQLHTCSTLADVSSIS